MKKVPLSTTYLSRQTQRDLGHIREEARFDEYLTQKFHPDDRARLAIAREIQRTVERIARREAKP